MKWKNFPRHWPLCGEFTGDRWIPHTNALMFSLICIWINGWVNNRVAGDLRRHLTHYDIIVMTCFFLFTPTFVFFVYGEYHVWTEGANCLCTHERGYFDVYFLSYDVMREINNEITLECVEKQSSGNGLSPVQHKAITWTNSGLLSVKCLGTNFNEILIRILSFPFKKMHLNLSSSQMAAILSKGQWVDKDSLIVLLLLIILPSVPPIPPSVYYLYAALVAQQRSGNTGVWWGILGEGAEWSGKPLLSQVLGNYASSLLYSANWEGIFVWLFHWYSNIPLI